MKECKRTILLQVTICLSASSVGDEPNWTLTHGCWIWLITDMLSEQTGFLLPLHKLNLKLCLNNNTRPCITYMVFHSKQIYEPYFHYIVYHKVILSTNTENLVVLVHV